MECGAENDLRILLRCVLSAFSIILTVILGAFSVIAAFERLAASGGSLCAFGWLQTSC